MSRTARRAPADDSLDRIFRALGDRTRRAILLRLAEGPAQISELAEPFDMSLPAVGKHIKLLESAGLIRRRIVGRNHICALEAKAIGSADEWLAFYRRYWPSSLEALADYVENIRDEK